MKIVRKIMKSPIILGSKNHK